MMREVVVLLVHLLARLAILLGTRGTRAVVAEKPVAPPLHSTSSVLEGVRRLVESEIPVSCKEGMKQIKRGEGIDLDNALPELGEA
jgi:hypothetical protein